MLANRFGREEARSLSLICVAPTAVVFTVIQQVAHHGADERPLLFALDTSQIATILVVARVAYATKGTAGHHPIDRAIRNASVFVVTPGNLAVPLERRHANQPCRVQLRPATRGLPASEHTEAYPLASPRIVVF